MIITPGGKQDICFANIASPGGDFIFHKKRKRRNGKREESLPKNVFFYSFRVLILFVVRFLLKVARDSSNLEEMLSGLWVLSTSVCGTGSFSAHTVTHSISENAHETQSFSTELRNPKNLTNNLPFRYNSKGNEREE